MNREHREQVPAHWNLPARAGRAFRFPYRDDLLPEVHLSPGKGRNLTSPHPGQECDPYERRKCLRTVGRRLHADSIKQASFLFRRKSATYLFPLFQLADLRPLKLNDFYRQVPTTSLPNWRVDRQVGVEKTVRQIAHVVL